MVDYIGVSDIQRLVRETGAAAFMTQLAGEIEADFRRWDEFDKSARAGQPLRRRRDRADADRRRAAFYSFKYVNGHPKNTAEACSTVMAFGVLADVATGAPLLLSELTLTTALRTAATSAMAARALARPNSRVMALIGNGAQSEFQALAFHDLLGIHELRLFDVDPAATAKLVRNLRARPSWPTCACSRRQHRRGRARRRHRHHRHRRQEQRRRSSRPR